MKANTNTNTNTKSTPNSKTSVYNLIILDASGSMGCVTPQTISGCNETIETIQAAQQQFSDTQEHFISIFSFTSNAGIPSRYLVKNLPAMQCHSITEKDYTPSGGTPLYDAVGSTLVDLKSITKGNPLAIGSVTIITDGYENCSTHYTLAHVVRLIEELKECGWNFNFIGANIDVKAAAASLKIDNALEFKQDAAGTRAMFEKERCSRMAYNARISKAMLDPELDGDVSSPSMAQRIKDRFKTISKGYFDEEDREI